MFVSGFITLEDYQRFEKVAERRGRYDFVMSPIAKDPYLISVSMLTLVVDIHNFNDGLFFCTRDTTKLNSLSDSKA